MIVVCVSDTHLRHLKYDFHVPDGDLLIHAGDGTVSGLEREVIMLRDWFLSQPHKKKVFVPGNHDSLFEDLPQYARSLFCDGNDTHLLIDQGVEINGVKIWGAPWQPEFMNWSFNLPRGQPLRDKWDLIPEGTDILVTHGPPHKIGDYVVRDKEHAGCEDLLKRVLDLKIKYHIFGHIHGGYGEYYLHGTKFINASICTDAYFPGNKPVVFDL